MNTGTGLKELRKEEHAAFKIMGRNKKKLEEIGNKLETKRLDLLEASIELQRLENEYEFKYSDNSTNAPESWQKYLWMKRGIEERIEKLEEQLQKEKRKKKECYHQSDKAKKIRNSSEASSWMLEAKDHADICQSIKVEISDYHGEIVALRKKAEAEPEYMELQTRIKLAKQNYSNLETEIIDLQKEYKTQEKIYNDSVKNHKSLKEKVEKIQKKIYGNKP